MVSKKEIVEVKPIELAEAVIRIKGVTPLIEHCWSEKSKRSMLDNMTSKSDKAKAKDPKNPVAEFIRSMYWITPFPTELTEEAFQKAIEEGARFGFPVTGFKQCAISGAYRKRWVPDKATLRGVFFVKADAVAHDGTEVVEIKGCVPTMREDSVKLQGLKSDLRYRGEFREWYADLRISYDVNGIYSIKDIVNYLNAGGFSVGVGEWRPEKDGQNGMFEVVAT